MSIELTAHFFDDVNEIIILIPSLEHVGPSVR